MVSTGGIKKNSDGKITEGSALIGLILHEVSDDFNETTNKDWEQEYLNYITNLSVSINAMIAGQFHSIVDEIQKISKPK